MAVPVWNTNDVPTASDFNVWFQNVIAAVKSANESVTSSTTMQNDDHLVLALAANSTYWVQGELSTDGAAAGDLKFQWTAPAGASCVLNWTVLGTAATGGGDDVMATQEAFGDVINHGTVAAGSHFPASFRGTVTIASTAGNLQLQWAQLTSSGTASRVLAGSAMFAQRIS